MPSKPDRRVLREALVKRDGLACNHCGKPEPDDADEQTKLTIDRVQPGGFYTLTNTQLLCRSCNSRKGTETETKTVRFASMRMRRGFVIFPNFVLFDKSLSLAARGAYAMLLHFARESEECWPGQILLAELLGISERKLRDSLRELEAGRLIKINPRARGLANVYTLLDDRQALPERPARGAGSDRHVVPVKEEAVKENPPCPPEGGALELELGDDRRPQRVVNRKVVSKDEWRVVDAVVEQFNATFGTTFKPTEKDTVSRIVMRAREYPEVTLDRHRSIVRAAAEDPWWGDSPPDTVGMVYGPRTFPKAMRVPEPKPKTKFGSLGI